MLHKSWIILCLSSRASPKIVFRFSQILFTVTLTTGISDWIYVSRSMADTLSTSFYTAAQYIIFPMSLNLWDTLYNIKSFHLRVCSRLISPCMLHTLPILSSYWWTVKSSLEYTDLHSMQKCGFIIRGGTRAPKICVQRLSSFDPRKADRNSLLTEALLSGASPSWTNVSIPCLKRVLGLNAALRT
jgi:hypothetical protein